jgi:uncharacterized protein (TIGR04255 family)
MGVRPSRFTLGRVFPSVRRIWPSMSDPTERIALPEYDNPPVVETVVGVQFDRLPGFKNPHLGAFWRAAGRDRWPILVDAPPLPAEYERFTETSFWADVGARIKLTQDPSSRLQMKNAAGDQMIQVQNGRLHFNWLRLPGGAYPRYCNVREGFASALKGFLEFLGEEHLGDFRPNQWEVTYLNQIPKDTVWSKPDDCTFFRPLQAIPTIAGLIEGESFSGVWHFVIPPNRGRLHVQWNHSITSDQQAGEIVVLTLTARGPLSAKSDAVAAALDGLDLGRETIVRAFCELMSDRANQHWGLKNAKNR